MQCRWVPHLFVGVLSGGNERYANRETALILPIVRGLSVAAGEGAEALIKAAGSGRAVYQGEIPQALIAALAG